MDKILIVDEDGSARRGLSVLLKHYLPELKLTQTDNGKQALDIVDTLLPGYILMDITFTDVKGLMLLDKMRSCCPDACIIVFTKKDSSESRQACFEQGANYFFSKLDESVSDLLLLINSHLHSKHL